VSLPAFAIERIPGAVWRSLLWARHKLSKIEQIANSSQVLISELLAIDRLQKLTVSIPDTASKHLNIPFHQFHLHGLRGWGN
jgi:hypothetical protein